MSSRVYETIDSIYTLLQNIVPTTGEYEFRGLGDNIFWISPLTQYHVLNFLIVKSVFLLHLKDHVTVITL